MSLISVNDLTFYYDGSYDLIFDHVTFQIDTNWKLGFIGRNGRGKTTFLNLLLGKYEYKGNITASVVFDYFPYDVKDKTKNTMDILEEMDPDYEFWKVCRELTLLQVEEDIWDRPFGTLSMGEQTKVMLAVLFARENHFLLIDEPTNHLDMETRQIVRDYLNKKKGFILVSHDRNFLDGCIDHVLSINKMNIEVVQGNFSSWYENKQREDAYEMAENERLKKDIARLQEAAKQTKQWADKVESTKIGAKSFKYEKCIDTRAYVGEKSRRMQQRRKNLERRQQKEIDEKSGLLKNIEEYADLRVLPKQHYQEIILQAKDLCLYYGDKAVCKPINLEIHNGDCVVLQGKNGAGKSTIVKKILGEDIQSTGLLTMPSGVHISYVSQDTTGLKGDLKSYAIEHGIDESLFKQFLRKLDFSREQFDKRIEEFSGGQKKKVLLAHSLCEQAHLYIWDEPLNFIDIFSRMQIEGLIKQYRPTMILVEHDRTFVENVATKIVKLEECESMVER